MPNKPINLRDALAKNAVAASIGQASNIATRLIQVPLLLSLMGATDYGHWIVLYNVPSLLLLGNFGFATSAANKIAAAINADEICSAKQTYATALAALFILAVAMVAIGFALANSQAILPATVGGSKAASDLSTCLMILVLAITAGLPLDLLAGIFRAKRKTHYSLYLSTLRQWLELLLITLAAAYGKTLVPLAIAVLAATALCASLTFYIAGKLAPELKFSKDLVSGKSFSGLFRNGLGFQGMAIGNALMLQGQILAVQHTLGPASVAAFNSVRTLVGVVMQSMGLINTITWSEFTYLIAKKMNAEAITLHSKCAAIALLIGTFGLLTMALLGPTIYTMWTRGAIPISNGTFLLFLLPIPLYATYVTSGVIHTSTNSHEGMAIRFAVGALLSTSACYALSYLIGLNGAALSIPIAHAFMVSYVVGYANQILGDTTSNFIKRTFFEVRNILLLKFKF